MHTSAAVLSGAVIPEPDEPRLPPTRDPPPGRAGDSAEVTLRLVQEHDRIAGGMNDIVVRRLFSAGLCLSGNGTSFMTLASLTATAAARGLPVPAAWLDGVRH